MAERAGGYTEDYLKKDVGPKLWRLLSELIDHDDIRVTKRNIQNDIDALGGTAKQPRPDSYRWGKIPALSFRGGGGDPMEASPPGAGVVADRASLQVWASPRLDVSDFFWQTGGSGAVAAMAAPSGLPGYLAVGNGRGSGKTTLIARLLASSPLPSTAVGLCQVIRRYYRRGIFFQALV